MAVEGSTPVNRRDDRSYRVQEFAELAGITVRALHHYDRLGLLKPRRTDAGYRLYRSGHLERLEQIVALKFLGIPLKQIKTLLDRNALDWPDVLRLQRRVLEDKRRLLDSAIGAIRDAEQSIRPGQRPDAAVLKKIIEVIEMQNNTDWARKYYSDEALERIEHGKQRWSPELQERITKEWTDLFRDVETAIARGEDPASEQAQALGERWKTLVEAFTAGDREISAGLNRLYADRANWPANAQQQMAPFSNQKVWEYIHKVIACR
jgi:MerR family transcriptional regulator, thiopeptide resistance regulator